MSDSLITIIAIFLAAILMFIFPLMTMADRTDDVSQLAVQTATTEFVDKVGKTGKLTLDEYDRFISTLVSTGNSYEIDMQVQHVDENPGVKVTQAEVTKVGENLFYTEQTSQIAEKLDEDNRITLKSGDMFTVKVKNTNKTIADSLRGFFFSITGGEDTAQIAGRHTTTVSVNGAN